MTCQRCGYCVYMDVTKLKEGRYYCKYLDDYQFADSKDSLVCKKECERFSKDKYLGDKAIEVSREWKKKNGYKEDKEDEIKTVEVVERESSFQYAGCFITTIVVRILGLDDNCEVLRVLRNFRNNKLQKEACYSGLLMDYDVIGPMISKKLCEDENREDLAIDLYFDYLVNCVDYLKIGDEERAVFKYIEMVNILKNHYFEGLSLELGSDVMESYDQSQGGHGRLSLS